MADYYYCEDCDSIFPQGSAATVTVPDGYGYKEIDACPDCRNTQLDVARSCKICGEPLPPNKKYCDECEKRMDEAWNLIIDRVMCRRYETGQRKGTDYIECLEAVLEWLQEKGVVL